MTNSVYHKNEHVREVNELVDYALHNAIKYKFDPVVGKIHQDYLNVAKELKKKIDNSCISNL